MSDKKGLIELGKSRTKELLDMAISEGVHLMKNAGKSFLSVKDIKMGWYITGQPDDVLKRSKRKTVFYPKLGCAEIDRIIKKHMPQQKTEIKLKSLMWSIPKSTRNFLYNLAYSIERDIELGMWHEFK